MNPGWKIYWCGLLLLLVYGVVPEVLAGRSETNIRMTKGQEQRVEFFQPFKGPLNVYVHYEQIKDAEGGHTADNWGLFDINIENSLYHCRFGVDFVCKILPSAPHVRMGNNIINIKIMDVSERLENKNISIKFDGLGGDLKRETFRPDWILDPLSFILLVYFIYFLDLWGFWGKFYLVLC